MPQWGREANGTKCSRTSEYKSRYYSVAIDAFLGIKPGSYSHKVLHTSLSLHRNSKGISLEHPYYHLSMSG